VRSESQATSVALRAAARLLVAVVALYVGVKILGWLVASPEVVFALALSALIVAAVYVVNVTLDQAYSARQRVLFYRHARDGKKSGDGANQS
jgi:hypothetical protein